MKFTLLQSGSSEENHRLIINDILFLICIVIMIMDLPPMSDQPLTHPPDEAAEKAAWHQSQAHHLQQQGQDHHLQGKAHHYSSRDSSDFNY